MKRIFLFPTLLFPLFAMAVDHRMTLDELVVQGSALEETLPSELADYGAELEIIDSEQLEKSGTSDVGQALQGNVPGLFLSPKTGRGDYVDISIQGSRTEDVLWLVDGVRINNRLFGGTTPLDSISTPMIERIEVLKGGQGLFYGTQAVAGVVNIVLRQPTDEPSGTLTGVSAVLGTAVLPVMPVMGRDRVAGWSSASTTVPMAIVRTASRPTRPMHGRWTAASTASPFGGAIFSTRARGVH